MASEDDDLELLLSMGGGENVVVSETPPSTPPASLKHSALRTSEKDGFYGKDSESTSAADGENASFSRRMADIRSNCVAKTKADFSRRAVGTTQSRSSILPTSGSADALGYCSDEETPKTKRALSMDAFKETFKDILKAENNKLITSSRKQASHQGLPLPVSSIDVEHFSGLKIKDRLLPPGHVDQKLEDLRFVRLPAIKMANECSKFAGTWATIAILVEKGQPRQSSSGKNFVIWKLGTLESSVVSLFLFGDAYKVHWKEQPGSILACLNANVRADPKTKEPSLSVFHCDQIITLGTSVNFAICNGIRKDGTRCTMAINTRVHGQYCQYHIGALQSKYKSKRPELNGGKISIVGPGYERGKVKPKPLDSPGKENTLSRPLKIVTTSELKSILSEEKLITKSYSQGKRFLENMADRATGIKRPTSLGEVKRTTSKSKTEKSVTEPLKNGNTLKAEVAPSAHREKLKDLSLNTRDVTLASKRKGKIFERATSNGPSSVNSKGDDKEIEIEWSEGPECDMVHALCRFKRVHVSLMQV